MKVAADAERLRSGSRRPGAHSASDVEDGVDVVGVHVSHELAGLHRGQGLDIDAASRRFLADVRPDRQVAVSTRADDQFLAAPRNVLGGSQRRVAPLAPKRLRRALVALTDPAAVHAAVLVVHLAVDLEMSERNQLRLHGSILPRPCKEAIASSTIRV